MPTSPNTDYLLKELGNNRSGVLGGLPVAEQTQDYFLVFKGAGGTGPEIIDNTAYFIQYIVDSEGNIDKPSQGSIARLNLLQNFPIGKVTTVRIDNASGINTQLDGDHTITGVGTQQPILYTQYGIPSSSYTQSISFITPGGAPAGSTIEIPDILGSMNKTNFFFNSSSYTQIKDYTVNLPPLEGASFSASNGTYHITNSAVENINTATFKISYNVVNNSTTTPATVDVDLRSSNFLPPNYSSLVLETDTFTIPRGVGVNRSFTVTTPIYPSSPSTTFTELAILARLRTGVSVTFSSLNFEIIGTSPNPSPRGQSQFWSTGSHIDVTWLTASYYLSLNYGNIQDTSNFPGTGGSFGLSPIKELFTPRPGDRIRFTYDPNKDYHIYEVISPDEDSDGYLKIKLNKTLLPTTILDNFVIHRVDNSSIKYLILDVAKDPTVDNPENPFTGVILPKYPSKKLKNNLENILSKLKQEGIIEN